MSATKEWTLMFYFASDNALAQEVVSQLKSIKNAGFQHEVNVIAYFDPQPAGTPAHIFDINAVRKAVRKLEHPNNQDEIGFAANDPFVRDLIEDRLWRKETNRDGKPIRELVIDQLKANKGITYKPPVPPPLADQNADASHKVNSGPTDSLQSFLKFCAENYQAEHYMLFILGHGLVVGDDVFLLDEHAAKHSVTLTELSKVLKDFKKDIRTYDRGAKFELVSFHSCSLSSLEVAFQLQGTANYMLASQGPAFVGSWPYRQILLRVFNDVAEANLKTPNDVAEMLSKIFDYVYHNSTDYLLAGYSFDVCLCDLRLIKTLKEPIEKLSEALVAGLRDEANPLVKYCILLAHWESQSYFQENYTDLYDFCLSLRRYCEKFGGVIGGLTGIRDACERVRIVLRKQESNDQKPVDPDKLIDRNNPADLNNPVDLNEPIGAANPIIKADFAGPDSQYSHGLSVYFPWARPTADRTIIQEYKKYTFNQTKWFSFLNQYWGDEKDLANSTMRDSHKTEVKAAVAAAVSNNPASKFMEARESDEVMLNEDIASLMFNVEGPLSKNGTLSGEKPNPQNTTGDSCTCGSIKNYQRDTRARRERRKSADEKSTYPVNQKITGI